MANWNMEMYQYRQVIHRTPQGQSEHAFARTILRGRLKCTSVGSIGKKKGWLQRGPLVGNRGLTKWFEMPKTPTLKHISLTKPYQEQIKKWISQELEATVIYHALVEQFGFTGSYSSVRRNEKKLPDRTPQACCVLDSPLDTQPKLTLVRARLSQTSL